MDTRTLSKLEGWKYTPFHGVALPEVKETRAPLFDNKGDQYLWERADVKTMDVAAGRKLTYVDELKTGGVQGQKIHVGKGGDLLHIRLIDTLEEACFSLVHASIEAGGRYTQIALSRGGSKLRLTTQAELLGEAAHADLRGVHVLNEERHVDHSINMRHMVPHCTSNQSIRMVVDGEAQAAFQGKIHVARDAQKTEAYQLCKSLLLSDGAQVNTKPELEIYADDVKCSHGATSGSLNEQALFYMQSRGIPREEAQALLMQAFIEEALDGLDLPEQVRAFLS